MASHVPPHGRGGGIVRYTVELARALARRDDVELHLLASHEAGGSLREVVGPSARVLQLPHIPGALVPAVERLLLRYTPVTSFDVVHGAKHLLPRARWPAGTRTVLTVHDLFPIDRAHEYPPAKRVLLRQPYAASLREADALVCVSSATRSRLVQWDRRLRGRASVVPLATSPDLLEASPSPVVELAGREFALAVGDCSPRKNLATVVDAWAQVVVARPDAVLALVGPPAWGSTPYGAHYERLVAAGHIVRLVGVSDGTLRWCYENAAVVLAPSLAEGFGLPAVEALDLGAPLITSLDPALVEVSGAGVRHLAAEDTAGWVGAVREHLGRGGGSTAAMRTIRTWDQVAAETLGAVVGAADSGAVASTGPAARR